MEEQVQSQNPYYVPNVALDRAKNEQSLRFNVDRAKMQAQATDSAAARQMRAEQTMREQLSFAGAEAQVEPTMTAGLGAL